ncbi:acyl-CoA carboxylase subunit epsilon [Actinokineospora sp. HUAS TT18]|uniref:acyl-CoA carboxylase subunit epsilon n=1 Tax=Actinokineospora sp. HUAS TT18 TaxID=3447451 RepID=UPI003F526918
MTESPLLRVVRGTPDDVELAALTAVVAAAGNADEETAPDTSAWSSRTSAVRRQLDHGPGAWRASGLPH